MTPAAPSNHEMTALRRLAQASEGTSLDTQNALNSDLYYPEEDTRPSEKEDFTHLLDQLFFNHIAQQNQPLPLDPYSYTLPSPQTTELPHIDEVLGGVLGKEPRTTYSNPVNSAQPLTIRVKQAPRRGQKRKAPSPATLPSQTQPTSLTPTRKRLHYPGLSSFKMNDDFSQESEIPSPQPNLREQQQPLQAYTVRSQALPFASQFPLPNRVLLPRDNAKIQAQEMRGIYLRYLRQAREAFNSKHFAIALGHATAASNAFPDGIEALAIQMECKYELFLENKSDLENLANKITALKNRNDLRAQCLIAAHAILKIDPNHVIAMEYFKGAAESEKAEEDRAQNRLNLSHGL